MGAAPKRKGTVRKYKAIQNRYQELYHNERLRHDDVIKRLCDEFFIMEVTTIYRILATKVDHLVTDNQGQLSIF